MLLKNRFIWSDNGTLNDYSDNLNNHISGSMVLALTASEDYLFLGAEAPFNHRWFEVSVANDQASTISEIAIWDGSQWVAVAEVIDLTKNAAGDTTLSQSGLIAWVPDKQKTGWSRDDTVDGGNHVITGLSNVKIYNLFWARIKFSGDLKATTEIDYVGHKFANDEDLYSFWPEFNTTTAKNRFTDGLTTFDQVHFEAAKQVIRDLKADAIITASGQILEWEVFRVPAIHKAAEIIYNAYGSDWEKEQVRARALYDRAMQVDLFNIDEDMDASLDVKELQNRQGRMLR